ncbi:hypothetical protein CL314_23250 [Salmonella enterica]|nr:hypothetical protein [Salmonella enterica]
MYNSHLDTLLKLNLYSKAHGYSPMLLFFLAPLYLSKSYAGVIRHDIDYIEYIQFGNNAGKYAAGNQNVAVYKKNGSQNIGSREADGKNSIPLMPDFYSVSDKGFATPFSYNMVVTAAHMKDSYTNETYGKRFYRTDLPLFENSNASDKDIKEQTYLKFILSAESIARNEYGYKPDINSINSSYFRNAEDIGVDTSVIRTDKMMFDTIPYPVATFGNVAKEDLLARNGAGIFLQPLQDAYSGSAVNVIADSYRYVHGSLTQVRDINSVSGQNVSFWLNPESQTALDSSSMGGDSGSPVFWWDKTAQNWLLLGINSQGGNNAKGYGKIGIMQTGNLTQVLNNATATQEITAGQTIKIDTTQNNIANFQFFSDEQKQASLELYKRRVMGSYLIGTRPWVKDLYLNNSGDGSVTLQIDGDTDIGTIPLYFNSNATIQGQGKFDLSGFSVAEGKTVTSNLTLARGSDWRKVGAGTLRIAGTAPGQGSLAVGEGTLELANQGTAADKVMLATGRGTVKLINPNQLNNNQIYFGVRGGKLDLNGHSLSFSDIYHLDRGANISNENRAEKSTFTFTADGERNYLGSFNGNLDLQYKPSQPTALWHLRGDSRIGGNLHIQQGRVNVAADRLIYTTILKNGYDMLMSIGDSDNREWRPNRFQSKTITLDNGAILGIGRAATVIADTITFAGNNQLEIAVQDSKRHNADAASIKGDKFLDPTFHAPSLKANLQFNGDNNQININTPEGFTTTIEGGMHGAAEINTAGKGRVIWKNSSPTVLQTKITAKDTALQINNSTSLDLSLSSNSDNIVLNNQKQATLRFAPSATILGENTKLNLDNGSQLTFAGMRQNTTQHAVAINADITTVNNNGVFPTITLSDENTTFHFKQPKLDNNLILQNGALGLHNALTISGDFSASPEYSLSKLVFGNINKAQLKSISRTEYELTNKLTVNGHVSGVVQPVFSLSDEVTTMLVDSVQKLTFVDYNSGSLYFINAPRIVNKGVEFSFTQDGKHTFLIDQTKISAAEKEKQEAERSTAEQAAAEQAAAEKAASGQAASGQAAAEQAAAEKAASGQAASGQAASGQAASGQAAAEQAAKISLSVKTAPEVGEYLTLIGSARNIVNINLNNAQSGFSVAYEGYYERDDYQHQYNFKSKVNGKGVVFNVANRLNDIDGGVQIRLADLATSTESDKVRLQSKTKLTSVIGYGGYYFDELKLYAALGVAKARFNTKIDGQAPTSMNSHFSSTGIFGKGGISYTQPFGNISLKEYIALSYNNLGLGELTDSNGDKIEVSDKLPLSTEVGVMIDYNDERWNFNAGIGVSNDLGKLQVRYKHTDRNYSRGTGKLKFNLDLGSSYKLAQDLYLTQDVKLALDSNHYQNSIFNLGVKFTW